MVAQLCTYTKKPLNCAFKTVNFMLCKLYLKKAVKIYSVLNKNKPVKSNFL